jgi:hypothetical protein
VGRGACGDTLSGLGLDDSGGWMAADESPVGQ